MADFNKGDAFPIELDYFVNGVPIEDAELDEIEVTIGSRSFTLTGGDIQIDEETGKYSLILDQATTFSLGKVASFQVRFKKDGEVTSTDEETIRIGRSLSKEII